MRVFTFSPFGYEGSLVEVEVDLRRGIPAVDYVGIADGMVNETRERVRAAIDYTKLTFPPERVLVSLSPADIRKDCAMELPIAIAILAKQYNIQSDDDIMVVGELERDAMVRPVRAVYSAITTALACGIRKFIIPKYNINELKSFNNVEYISAHNLGDTFMDLAKGRFKKMENTDSIKDSGIVEFPPIPEDVDKELPTGYSRAVRAMQVAAAGGHNVLFYGAPGCGKTLLLQKMMYLLPLNTIEDSQTVTRIHSIAGLVSPHNELIRRKPFRMPHQTASIEGICGGGPNCRPGEISLAHNGVLFLDEANEFRTSVLQMLRVPLESHSITLCRAGRSTVYPANFQLLMAVNPCPCGNYGVTNHICLCSVKTVTLYWKKFSDPLLDRIDIRMKIEKDTEDETVFNLEELRIDIGTGVAAQRKRGKSNQNLSPTEIPEVCKLSKECQNILDIATERGLTTRGTVSVLKIARTIADMAGSEDIQTDHLNEALSLREYLPLDM